MLVVRNGIKLLHKSSYAALNTELINACVSKKTENLQTKKPCDVTDISAFLPF